MRASSCASTTTRRARSVNGSNMSSLLPQRPLALPAPKGVVLSTLVRGRDRGGRTDNPLRPTWVQPPAPGGCSRFAASERACRETSVSRVVRLADLGGDPAAFGHVPAVLAGPGPDLRGLRTAGRA